VFKSFQVPDTRVFQSISGPPPIPRTLATGPKAVANPGAVSRATTRPLQAIRKPVPGYGTKIGDSILGPGDPYQVPGLLEDLGLAAQVERRTSDSVKIIRDNLNAARNKRFDRALPDLTTGSIIKKTIQKEIGKAGAVTDLKYAKRVAGDMALEKQYELYGAGLREIGRRTYNALKKKALFRVIETKDMKVPPIRGPIDDIFLLSVPMGNLPVSMVMLHMIYMLDKLGRNGEAAVISRNKHFGSDAIFQSPESEFLNIRSGDIFSGRKHGSSKEHSDWTSTAYSTMAPGQEKKLALLWDMNPDQVGFLMAYLGGQFF
jgi:hypothetical protein